MSLDDSGATLHPILNIWLLQPRNNLKKGDNPWDPWYDKCFGFVIRAKDEKSAREYADANAGGENFGGFLGKQLIMIHPWRDSNYSTYTQLAGEGEEGILIKDRRQA